MTGPDPNEPGFAYDWIDVQLRDAFTNQPLPGVKAFLYQGRGNPQTVYIGKTDGNGWVRVYLTTAPEGSKPLNPWNPDEAARYGLDPSWAYKDGMDSGVLFRDPAYFTHEVDIFAASATAERTKTILTNSTVGLANGKRVLTIWKTEYIGAPHDQPHPLDIHEKGYAWALPRAPFANNLSLQDFFGIKGNSKKTESVATPQGLHFMYHEDALPFNPRRNMKIYVQAKDPAIKERMRRAVLKVLEITDHALGFYEKVTVKKHPMAFPDPPNLPWRDPTVRPPNDDGIVIVYHDHSWKLHSWGKDYIPWGYESWGLCTREKWYIDHLHHEFFRDVYGRDFDERGIEADAAYFLGMAITTYAPFNYHVAQRAGSWFGPERYGDLRLAIKWYLLSGQLPRGINDEGDAGNPYQTGQHMNGCNDLN